MTAALTALLHRIMLRRSPRESVSIGANGSDVPIFLGWSGDRQMLI